MSKQLQEYIERFGHIVGTKFSPEQIPAMEKVAEAYQESFNRNWADLDKRNRDAH